MIKKFDKFWINELYKFVKSKSKGDKLIIRT